MASATRRTFLKTAAVAVDSALVPSIALPKLAPLWDFVDDDAHFRYDLTAPFSQGDVTYATDARIMLCIDGQRFVDGEERQLPNMTKYPFASAVKSVTDWKPWPREHLFTDPRAQRYGQVCPECRRRGRVGQGVRQCPTCGGSCEVVPTSYDIEMPCPDCRTGWVGGLKCDYCDGSGDVKGRPSLQRMDTLVLAGHYARRVAVLPGAEYCEISFPGASSHDPHLVAFRCDGAWGYACPIAIDD